jgi:hypothetical protein
MKERILMKDRDEKIIIEAFKSMKTPEFEILTDAEGAKERPARRRIVKRSVVLAFAAVLVMATSVVAGYYINNFERIRENVTEGMAQIINPVDAEIVENHPWHNLAGRLWGADAAAYDGIKFEILGTGIFDNVLDVYFIVQDLHYNRLGGDFIPFASVTYPRHNANPYFIPRFHAPEILERLEDGKVLMRGRFFMGHPLSEGRMYFHMGSIRYNEVLHEVDDFGIDLAALLSTLAKTGAETDAETIDIRPPGASLSILFGGTIGFIDSTVWQRRHIDSTGYFFQYGTTVLAPNVHNLELDLPGMDVAISSIGIIGERLHIQVYNPNPDPVYSTVQIWLNGPDGENVNFVNSIRFNMTDNGRFYSVSSGRYNFIEYIFDIDVSRLGEYRLAGVARNFGSIVMAATMAFDVETADFSDIPVLNQALQMPMNMRFSYNSEDEGFIDVYLPIMLDNLRISPISVTLEGSFIGIERDERGAIRTLPAPPDDNPVVDWWWHWSLSYPDILRIYTADGAIEVNALGTAANMPYYETFTIIFEVLEELELEEIVAVYLMERRVH